MKEAFTLIELLVVVLIIGILASIALPQYKKAVDKARLSEMLIQGRALLEAQKLYIMENGHFSADLNVLNIGMPVSSWYCGTTSLYCASRKTPGGAQVEINAYYGSEHLSLMCHASTNNTYALQLCSSLGTELHENSGRKYYLIYKQ